MSRSQSRFGKKRKMFLKERLSSGAPVSGGYLCAFLANFTSPRQTSKHQAHVTARTLALNLQAAAASTAEEQQYRRYKNNSYPRQNRRTGQSCILSPPHHRISREPGPHPAHHPHTNKQPRCQQQQRAVMHSLPIDHRPQRPHTASYRNILVEELQYTAL